MVSFYQALLIFYASKISYAFTFLPSEKSWTTIKNRGKSMATTSTSEASWKSIFVAANEVTCTHPPARYHRTRLMSGDDDYGNSGSVSSSDVESFRMVYTCNRCNTRNMIQINRKAWDEGIVITTCQGCNVKHLIADNKGLLDVDGTTNFTNVIDYVRNVKMEEPQTLIEKVDTTATLGAEKENSNDSTAAVEAILSDFDLKTDDNGNIQLMPRPGDTNIVQKDRISAVGPDVDPTLIIEDTKQPGTLNIAGVENIQGTEGDDDAKAEQQEEGLGSARMDPYGGSFVIDMPADVEPGDVLQLSLDDNGGIMILSVPNGTVPGGKVEIQGSIEFMIPNGKVPGDVIVIQPPQQPSNRIDDKNTEILIPIPAGMTEGSFLKVAYPAIPVLE